MPQIFPSPVSCHHRVFASGEGIGSLHGYASKPGGDWVISVHKGGGGGIDYSFISIWWVGKLELENYVTYKRNTTKENLNKRDFD